MMIMINQKMIFPIVTQKSFKFNKYFLVKWLLKLLLRLFWAFIRAFLQFWGILMVFFAKFWGIKILFLLITVHEAFVTDYKLVYG